MSITTAVPADTGPVETPKKRPLWRRALRVAKWTFGTLLVLVVVALVFLHTSWGKSAVRGRIEARLGTLVNGEVTLGTLDYGFLFSSVELGELEIKDASGRPAIRIASFAADLDRGSILDGKPTIDELRIDGLAVALVRNADGTSNLTGLFKPSDRKPLEQIKIAKLAVTGSATITKPDGSVIAISDLALAGEVDARPASKAVDLALAQLAAKVTVRDKTIPITIAGVKLARRPDSIDANIGTLSAGALAIEAIAAHVELADGKLAGSQSVKVTKLRVDSKQLAELAGRQVLLGDVAVDLAVAGPIEKLAITGHVKTRETTLALDGTADASNRARPSYQLALVGKGKSTDVVARPGRPEIAGEIRIDVAGSGVSAKDLDAVLAIAVGPTKVGRYDLDSLTVRAAAKAGTYTLEQLTVRGIGFAVDATGVLAKDKTVTARVRVHGSPEQAMQILAAAGVRIPEQAPALKTLDTTITASGKLDGTVVAELAPTRIAIAGGQIGLVGRAELVAKKLDRVTAKVTLRGIDLAAAARLAGRPPKVHGTLEGTVDLSRIGEARGADYNLAITLRDPAVRVIAKGTANVGASVTAHAEIVRASDQVVLAVVDARLPLDHQGFQPRGTWRLTADVAKRSLAEIQALLPSLRDKQLPAGAVAVRVELAGSPAAPRGTIVIAGTQADRTLDLTATVSSTPSGLAIATQGTIADRAHGTLATIGGGVTTGPPFAGKQVDREALRASAKLDLVLDIPERDLASLADLRAKLAELGGKMTGTIAVRGPLATPGLDANLRWHSYKTATGAEGETTIAATGTPKLIDATIGHNGKLAITARIDRSVPDRIAVEARAVAAETPLLPLIPAAFASKLAGHDAGKLRWNMDAALVLVRGDAGLALQTIDVTGSLDVKGAAFALPNSRRRWHDIGLEVVAEAQGIRIKSLALRESDLANKARRLDVSGMLALDNASPRQLTLALAANDWLLFGTPQLGANDAPRAAADFDIGVVVDLTTPIIGVDATVHSLALRAPDRLDRGHQPELASISGDIIYVDGNTVIGKLPVVAPIVAEEPKKRRAIDVRIHVPKAIRLNQTPFDVMATGELTVTVRDAGVVTRGGLTMQSGTLSLFGHEHQLVEGSLTFTDEHPKGWLALTFERPLPDVALRELGNPGGARVTFTGSPTKPKTTLGGDANAALLEVMAMYQAGRPVHVARPGLPATNTVQAPRGDQLFVLTFMAQNLPHLLFLDRISAWADPYQGAGSYGQIKNVEAEGYGKRSRIRAVVRPTTPGRSNAELQWDRVFVDSNRAAFGVGVRAGDRLGGGVGLFLEWSSRD